MSDMSNLNRDIGMLQGQLAGIVATLARVDERSAARDKAFEEIRDELREVIASIGVLQKQAADQVIVTNQFNELQKSIREGYIQAKGMSKGFLLGISAAAAGTGATVVMLWKEVAALIGRIFTGT
jgi:hypothetical protein